LPHVALKEADSSNVELCASLMMLLRDSVLYAHCPQSPDPVPIQARVLREAKVTTVERQF